MKDQEGKGGRKIQLLLSKNSILKKMMKIQEKNLMKKFMKRKRVIG